MASKQKNIPENFGPGKRGRSANSFIQTIPLLVFGFAAFSIAQPFTARAEEASHPERPAPNFSAGLAGDEQESGRLVNPTFEITAEKSLLVTDLLSVEQITLKEVMEKLSADAVAQGDKGATAARIFDSWWAQGKSPNCPAVVNGFPYACDRAETNETSVAAFGEKSGQYKAIGIVNRIDLAASDWSSCGEQRLVFAKTGSSNFNRNLLIFEADVRNPDPANGKDGCEPIAAFWIGQSNPAVTPEQRGAALKDFFLNGLPAHNISAPVSLAGYGFHTTPDNLPVQSPPRGQIRSNQFMEQPWLLREFRFHRLEGEAQITLAPQLLGDNPAPELFAVRKGDSAEGQAGLLADEIITQLNGLTLNDPDNFGVRISRKFNPADADSQNLSESYAGNFAGDSIIGERLASANLNGLKPVNIVSRIQALSCGGCHQQSNNKADLGLTNADGSPFIWPASASFVHIDETRTTMVDDNGRKIKRFVTSPSLQNFLLPARLKLLKMRFIAGS
jgi:hypothetical protein